MLAYLVRRLLYALPILIGVNVITFALFFIVNTPDDMARMQLGVKRVTPEAIDKWKAQRGYDKPLFINEAASGSALFTDTIFFSKSARMFAGDFGRAEDGRDIAREITSRMGPSLAIALADFHPRPAGDCFLCADADFFSRQLPRFLGRRAVRGADVDLRPVLHHRRPVSDQQDVEAGADLGLRWRPRCLEIRHPAGADRGHLGDRFVDALVSHHLP
jgi:hypothetical protein